MTTTTTKRAVIYLRVSTRDQAKRGGETEGFSIPAQREACHRKAKSLGAEVIEEFIDAGESAKSAQRPELQRMLTYVKHNTIQLVIVHKVDRLARNRMDWTAISFVDGSEKLELWFRLPSWFSPIPDGLRSGCGTRARNEAWSDCNRVQSMMSPL